MTTKPTKRDYFMRLHEIVTEAEVHDAAVLSDFIAHEIELLDRKHKGTSGPKPETLEARTKTVAALGLVDVASATAIASMTDMSVQRVTAALTALVKSGEVVREQHGKEVRFSLK